ncbi:hypothetical protein HMPREF9098_0202 [Kingella denitrificans ATCC 33394]|uniref:Uncharacterized protein n=1 Tax=Kingella denitrificans ATCC 33394 TaxID=888741 RepID=F0EWG8_9NEIS|nr:hypothetical protein HMPREF9098_0202 [Kingella denitrificans ATCC 33394]
MKPNAKKQPAHGTIQVQAAFGALIDLQTALVWVFFAQRAVLPRLCVAAVLRAAIVHQHIRFGAQRRAMLQLRVVRAMHFHIQLRLMAFIQAAAACAAVQRQPLFQFVIRLRAAVAQGDARATARIQRRQRKTAVQRHRPPLIQMGKRQLHFRIITLPLHGFRQRQLMLHQRRLSAAAGR